MIHLLLALIAALAMVQEPVFENQQHCPVDGVALEGESKFSLVYEGQRLSFSDAASLAIGKQEPEVMLARLAWKGQHPESIHTACPITGEVLEDREIVVWIGNKSVAVCCQKCARKVAGNPSAALDQLEGRGKQSLCPQCDQRIQGNFRVELAGYRVRAHSQECVELLRKKKPEDVFAKLAAQKVVLEPISTKCWVHPKLKRDRKQFVTLGAQRKFFCTAECRKSFLEARKVPKKKPAESGTGSTSP